MSTPKKPRGQGPEPLTNHLDWARNLAHSLVRDTSSADDLVQDAWVLALERPPRRVEDRAGFRAWMSSVLRRLAQHGYRSEQRLRRRQAEASRSGDVPSTLELLADQDGLRHVANQAMALERPDRQVLIDHYFGAKSVAVIAEEQGLAPEAVRQRLTRARARLRVRLERDSRHGRAPWWSPLAWSWRGTKLRAPGRLMLGCAMLALAMALVTAIDGDHPPVEESIPMAYADPEPLRPEAPRHPRLAGFFGLHGTRSTARGGWNPEDDAALSKELGVPVRNATRHPLEAEQDELAALERRMGWDPGFLRSVEVFTGDVEHRRATRGRRQGIARILMPALGPEARLVLACEDGLPITLGIWGTPEFDTDPDRRWGVYMGLLLSVARSNRIGALDASRSEQESAIQALLEDEEQGTLFRALVDQRAAMKSNLLYTSSKRVLARIDQWPPEEWFSILGGSMAGIAENAEALEPILGAKTQDYRRFALAANAAYGELREAVVAQDRAVFERLDADRDARCKACHNEKSSPGEVQWFNVFDTTWSELNPPRGVLKVGYDLAPALGDELGETSQELADALRRGIVLLDKLE